MVSNSVFWNNADRTGETESAQIHLWESDPVVRYTLIQGLDLFAAGEGNVGDDPLFVSHDDLRLGAGSPAIDAGDPNTVLEAGETDLDGQDRVLCDRVDMGAFEFNPPLGCGGAGGN